MDLRTWAICLSYKSIPVMKRHDQKQPGEERLYLAYISTSLFTDESLDRNSNRTGTCRLELMQRPRRGAAYWLVLYGLLSLFSYKIWDHQPRDDTTHNGLINQSVNQLIKKMPYNLILWNHFLNWHKANQHTWRCSVLISCC